MKPGRAPRGAKRERVIAEAARTLNAFGVSNASLPLIAEHLGVSRAALYYYVEDQEDLVFQSYRRTCESLARHLDAAEEAGGEAMTIVERFVDRVLTAEGPELAALSDLAYLGPERRETIEAQFNALRSRLAEVLAVGIARGEVRPCAVKIVAMAIVGLVLWLPMAKIWPSSGALTHEDLVAAVKTMLRQGIAGDRSETVVAPHIPLGEAGNPLQVFDAEALAAAKQDALLKAASWLFNLKGVDATSLDEIAARVGATKRVIYHNLGDKETLVAACYSRSFRIYESVARQCEALPGRRISAVAASVQAYAEAGMREDVAAYTPITGFGALPAPLQAQVNESTVRLMETFLRIYSQGEQDGSIRALNARAVLAVNPGTFQSLAKWQDLLTPAERARVPQELAELNRIGLLPV